MSSLKSTSSDSPAPGTPHRVTDGEAGNRLDKLVSGLPGIASREMARRLIEQGAVTVNEQAGAPAQRVHAGDMVYFSIPPPEPSPLSPQPYPLRILHEDPALIVIDKAAGVPMHPGPGHREGTLVNYLLAHCQDLSGVGGTLRPGIVHRLDKDSSGVVVAAKHDAAHHHLAAQFKAHSVRRRYLALAVGRPEAEQGTIDQPLARQRSNRFKRSVREDGKRAVTHWRVMSRFGPVTLLMLTLETGRTHQIRVHLAHAGWPVLGDPLYGKARHRGLKLDGELMEILEGLKRQALHATELGFVHPDTGQSVRFSSPLPPDMAVITAALKKFQEKS